tara:strand:- start:6112 stop:6306 length:195 start_codon:yes stop_codon:yes gene_type:complete
MTETKRTALMTLADFTAIELLVRAAEAQNYIYEQVALDGIARRHGYADFEDYNFAREEFFAEEL